MNNSLKKLVQKSNLQVKSDFEIISKPNLVSGGVTSVDGSCNNGGDGVCNIVINFSCPVTNNSCTPKKATIESF